MTLSIRISRRHFLQKGVAVAASAIAVPSVIPVEVFGKPRPNERIGLGFIGVGRRPGCRAV